MKFKNINNATTIVESKNFKLTFDPWIIGNLYQNSWSPFPKQNIEDNLFKKITHIFISHIDQDHWGLETIKKIDRKAKVIIPDIVFNKLIKKKLHEIGFQNLEMSKMGVWKNFNKQISYYIIPPLNEMAQEFSYYNKFKNFQPIAIDTGLLIKDKTINKNHLILGDNSPYDLKSLKKHVGKLNISTFWFPFNGFAQDYPLCFDNFSLKEKKEISLKLSLKREKNLIEAIKLLKPEYLFPHSSDFALNGPRRNEFFKVHDKNFLYKEIYARRLEKKTEIKTLALFAKDFISIKKDNVEIYKKTTFKESFKISKNVKLHFPKADNSKNSLEEDFQKSISAMKERAIRYKIPMTNIKKWIFQLEVGKKIFYADLDTFIVHRKNPDKKKYSIKLKTSRNLIRCIMQKKIHLNNAIIGNYLSWERKPNIYNKFLWDMLSFFHLPLEKNSYAG